MIAAWAALENKVKAKVQTKAKAEKDKPNAEVEVAGKAKIATKRRRKSSVETEENIACEETEGTLMVLSEGHKFQVNYDEK